MEGSKDRLKKLLLKEKLGGWHRKKLEVGKSSYRVFQKLFSFELGSYYVAQAVASAFRVAGTRSMCHHAHLLQLLN